MRHPVLIIPLGSKFGLQTFLPGNCSRKIANSLLKKELHHYFFLCIKKISCAHYNYEKNESKHTLSIDNNCIAIDHCDIVEENILRNVILKNCFIHFRHFLAIFWQFFGNFLAIFWAAFRQFLTNFWPLFGNFWQLFYNFLAFFWQLFYNFLAFFWQLFGNFLAIFWQFFGNFRQFFGNFSHFYAILDRIIND